MFTSAIVCKATHDYYFKANYSTFTFTFESGKCEGGKKLII